MPVSDITTRQFLSQYRALLTIFLITIATIHVCLLCAVFVQQEKGELLSISKLRGENFESTAQSTNSIL